MYVNKVTRIFIRVKYKDGRLIPNKLHEYIKRILSTDAYGNSFHIKDIRSSENEIIKIEQLKFPSLDIQYKTQDRHM